MKKNLLTMAAALALVSCSQDELLPNGSETVANGKIGANIFVPTTTRGAALNTVEDLISSQNGFDLVSYYNLEDTYTEFMGTTDDGIQFKHNGSAWDYADRGEIHFWQSVPDEATDMKFFAVSPTKENLPTDASYSIGTDAQTITYTVPGDVSEQKDLMFAQTDLEDGEYEPTSEVYRNGVPLNFHHALSQIVFKARIADKEDTDGDGTSDYVKAYVNSVSVKNVHGAGTFDMNAASTILGENYYEDGDLDGMDYNNTLWTPSDDATKGYIVSELTNNAEITWIEAEDLTNGAIGTETAMLLLPQQLEALDLSSIGADVNSANEKQISVVDISAGAYLEVNCRVEYTNNDNEVTYIVGADADSFENIYIPISTNWQPGYKYVYTLIFSADSGDPVKAIVESVDEWNTAAGENVPEGGDNDDADDSNMLLLNMNAADMFVGDELEILKHSAYSTRSSGAPLTFEIEHSDIAVVTDDNKIKAVKAGLTTITVSCDGYDETAEVQINVLPTLQPITLSEANRVKTVNIGPGSYTMGNTYNDEYIIDAPAHPVTIANNFYMGQYEVTVGQFVEFINANSDALKVMENYEWEGDAYSGKAVVYAYIKDGEETYKTLCTLDINNITGDAIGSLSVSDEHKDLPIRCSWEGAAAFAHSVGGYLPHEEEWEYAARGGTQNKIWWMDDDNKVDDSEFSLPYSWVIFDDDNFETDEAKKQAYSAAKDLILQYENLPYRYTEDNETYTYNLNAEDPVVETTNVQDETTFSLRPIDKCQKSNPWGLYNVLGNVAEWCGNYDYDYELGIPDEVNHVVRGDVPDIEYQLDNITSIRYKEGEDEPETSTSIWLGVVLHDFMGVAFRNNNTDMNQTGFRVAFASDYSGTNSSVQTISQGE